MDGTLNIFLTGAAGFIGSNTAETLIRQGHRVVGFDNLMPVYSVAKKRHNLDIVQGLAAGAGQFVFAEGDLRHIEVLRKAMSREPFDAVIHLAAMAGVQPSIADPQLYS